MIHVTLYGPLRRHRETGEEVVLTPELADSPEEATVNGLKTDQEDTDFGWMWRRDGDVIQFEVKEVARTGPFPPARTTSLGTRP